MHPVTLFSFFICIFVSGFHSSCHSVLYSLKNTKYRDVESLHRGQQYPSVNLVLTSQGAGTGVLVDLPDFQELRGRLVLTAAHVIQDMQEKIQRDKSHDPDILTKLVEAPILPSENYDSTVPQPIAAVEDAVFCSYFIRNDERTRPHDYGLILLDRVALPDVSLRVSTSSTSIDGLVTVVGCGEKQVAEEENAIVDTKKRLFTAKIARVEGNVLYSRSLMTIEEDVEQVFPYKGDSGCPFFSPSSPYEILGIVSGLNDENESVFIRPPLSGLQGILRDMLRKRQNFVASVVGPHTEGKDSIIGLILDYDLPRRY